MNDTVSKKVPDLNPSGGHSSVLLLSQFATIIRARCSQASSVPSYFWDLNGKAGDLEGFHNFLGILLEDSRTILDQCGLLQNGSVSKSKGFELSAKVNDKTFCESVPYKWKGQVKGEDKPRQEKRIYLRLGSLQNSLAVKVGDQYSKGILKVLPPKLSRDEATNTELIKLLKKCKEGQMDTTNTDNNSTSDKPSPSPDSLEKVFLDSTMSICGSDVNDTRLRRRMKRIMAKFIKSTLVLLADVEQQSCVAESVTPTSTSPADESPTSLLKDFFSRSKRSVVIKAFNGKDQTIVSRPFSSSTDGFVREAKRSNWVEDLLPDENYRLGFLRYMGMYHGEEFTKVAEVYRADVRKTFNTFETEGFASYIGLNLKQLEKCRGWLRQQGIVMELQKKETEKICDEVGIRKETEPTFGVCEFEISEKETEACPYWHANIIEDVCSEIEMHHRHLLMEGNDVSSLDYQPKGLNCAGINVLFGGDHGDKYFRMFCRLQLTSPELRKQKGDMSYGCPQLMIGNIECKKDHYELLYDTIMPTIDLALGRMKESSVIMLFNKEDASACKAFMVPKTIIMHTVHVVGNSMRYKCQGDPDQWREETFPTSRSPTAHEAIKYDSRRVITSFQSFLTGDCAYLCMTQGLNNSSGCWCHLCEAPSSLFHDDAMADDPIAAYRSLASIEANRLDYVNRPASQKGKANKTGVNTRTLLNIEPSHVLVPILHCPMGLVDKILETFSYWAYVHVLKFTGLDEEERNRFREAEKGLTAATEDFQRYPSTTVLEEFAAKEQAHKRLTQARKERASANKVFTSFMKRVKQKSDSFHGKTERILKEHGILREVYHGGKLNGVMSIKIMTKAKEVFTDLGGLLKEMKEERVSDEEIEKKCEVFEKLFGNGDAIWSAVRGLEGLLPTDDHLQNLRKALKAGKKLWLDTGLTTMQPKWHLTFRHLIEQVIAFGGLADKTDEYVEKGHQYWKSYQAKYCRMVDFRQQQLAIRNSERKSRHPRVSLETSKMKQQKGKHSLDTNRKRKAADSLSEIKASKEAKREGYRQ
jgi:hypothetical protein